MRSPNTKGLLTALDHARWHGVHQMPSCQSGSCGAGRVLDLDITQMRMQMTDSYHLEELRCINMYQGLQIENTVFGCIWREFDWWSVLFAFICIQSLNVVAHGSVAGLFSLVEALLHGITDGQREELPGLCRPSGAVCQTSWIYYLTPS